MKNKNEFLNSTDIARILGVTPPTIINMLNKGIIKSTKVSERIIKVEPIDLIIYLENLGNDRASMAGFKVDIYKFLYSKYGNKEYWEEIGKQVKLFRKYTAEREKARVK